MIRTKTLSFSKQHKAANSGEISLSGALQLNTAALGLPQGTQTAAPAGRLLPACLGVAQAEVDTVQALVCVGAVAAFVSALRMAHTLKTQALLFIQRDAFSIQSSPRVPLSGYRSPQVRGTSRVVSSGGLPHQRPYSWGVVTVGG